jgi:hypothetical protein
VWLVARNSLLGKGRVDSRREATARRIAHLDLLAHLQPPERCLLRLERLATAHRGSVHHHQLVTRGELQPATTRGHLAIAAASCLAGNGGRPPLHAGCLALAQRATQP